MKILLTFVIVLLISFYPTQARAKANFSVVTNTEVGFPDVAYDEVNADDVNAEELLPYAETVTLVGTLDQMSVDNVNVYILILHKTVSIGTPETLDDLNAEVKKKVGLLHVIFPIDLSIDGFQLGDTVTVDGELVTQHRFSHKTDVVLFAKHIH
ncbi:hypothetical protein D5018_19705 [Parashewanella curva]|uniref:DUF4431 domain-containing protein n=1 Tax=Parashewanella curva TaxID=2338552 RepID=A0A3L8PV94_9GAMM|nr:hypothetical protein [Parashewanella curva]RLV57972.1 hypothetical protein D5018_19705 [Parashewanella curva]